MQSYRPSLSDIGENASSQDVYRPSLSDLSQPVQNTQEDEKKLYQQKLLDSLMGKGQTPLGNIRDFLYGGGSAMAHLAQLVNPNAPAMPDIRQTNPNPIFEGIGRYLPYGLAGGGSLLGSTLGAGAYGATQFDKNQNGLIDSMFGLNPSRTRNTLEDMAINALSHGLLTSVVPKEVNPQVSFKQNAMFRPGESQFTNTQFTTPSFLNEPQPKSLSPQIASELHQNLGLGKSLEETGKNLASSIRDTYNQVKGAHQERYENILNTPTGDISIFDDNPILVRDKLMLNGKYRNNYKNADFQDKNIQQMHDEFMENPSVQNAHNFQSELGSEIGYLSKQKSNGVLDSTGKNKLKDYIAQRKTLIDDMRNELNNVSPELKNEYDQVTQDWKNNVEPFHSDKDLKAISQGKIKNPTSSQIVSIFKNPEESINKVVSYLPDSAKDNIAYIGAGKMPYQNTPKDVLSGMNSIESKGLSSYLRPEHQQYYANLRNNVALENEREMQNKTNQTLISQLKSARDELEQKRISSTKNSLSNFDKAQKEANALLENKQKEYQDIANKLVQEKYQKKLDRVNALRSILGGGIGAAIVHGLNLNPEDVIGSYVGKQILKKSKKL